MCSDCKRDYLVMDFYPLGSCLEFITKHKNELSEGDLLQMAYSAANTLQIFHSLPFPILHRDIAARNFLVSQVLKGDKKCYELVVADFGTIWKKI